MFLPLSSDSNEVSIKPLSEKLQALHKHSKKGEDKPLIAIVTNNPDSQEAQFLKNQIENVHGNQLRCEIISPDQIEETYQRVCEQQIEDQTENQ